MVKRSWPGGPLRQWNAQRKRLGSYVCDKCRKAVIGLYRRKKGWLCDDCLPKRKKINYDAPDEV